MAGDGYGELWTLAIPSIHPVQKFSIESVFVLALVCVIVRYQP